MSKSRHRRQKLPVDAVELQIERLSHDGRGIAYIDGKIAFVTGALAGERVLALFTGRRSQYDELKLESVLQASTDRREPRCRWAEICGGCSLQHLDAAAQIALKQHTLLDQLQHAAKVNDYEVLPPLLAAGYSYRRKARLAVRYVHKKETTLVGFREKNSSFIADMLDCPVLEKDVSVLITPLRELLTNLEGKASIPQIEVAVGETGPGSLGADEFAETAPGVCQVALIVRHLEPLVESDEKQLLLFAQNHQLELYLQPKGPDSVHKIWPLDDNQRLYYYLPEYDLKMAFHPTDFTQVNAAINRKMISAALQLLDLQPEDTVLDLFCGLGNFTLPMARQCASVTGVEGSQEMVLRGAENATLNNVDNVQFYAADLTVDFDTKTWAQPRYNKILLDPPRSGALEIIPRLVEFSAEKIVYISCNPATLARDTAELINLGYRLNKAGVMDMFPQTSHVESIAEFVKVKKKRKPTSQLL